MVLKQRLNTIILVVTLSMGWAPSLMADFWALPDFDDLKIQEKEDFKEAFIQRKKLPITSYNPVVDFDLKSFHALYSDIANLAVHYKLTNEATSLLELRQRINVICTYPIWGDKDKQDAGLQRIYPSILLSLSYLWLHKELPGTELAAFQKRLQKTLYRYWNEFQKKSEAKWVDTFNHPHYTMHLFAMSALSHAVVKFNQDLATEVLHHVKRQFTRYLRLMGDAEDSSLPQGLLKGSLTDLGLMLYYENELREQRRKEFDESIWLKERSQFYKLSILPGQKEILRFSMGLDRPDVRLAPVLWRWASWYQDKELQFLADACDREIDADWDMWSFLKLLTRSRGQQSYWNDELVSHYFDEAGLWTARSGRRPQSSQLTFLCGNPFGASIYNKVSEGYPNFSLDFSTPSQGSFTWFCEGRHIFDHAGRVAKHETEHYSTLMVDHRGQLFEAYPRVLPEQLVERSVSGRMQNTLRFGDSLLVRGEFADCYPDDLGLSQFNRTLIWLGETILVIVDLVQADKERDLAMIHRSTQNSFIEKEKGFYQKLSGLEMRTWSMPEGRWQVGQDRLPQTQAPHYFATHHAKAKQWLRISVMAPSAWVQDFRSENSVDRHLIDFSQGGYQIHLMPRARPGDSWLKVMVRQKTFFDLKVDL